MACVFLCLNETIRGACLSSNAVLSGVQAAEEAKRRVARSEESVRLMKLSSGSLATGFGGSLRFDYLKWHH
jgi:hypothetical protein